MIIKIAIADSNYDYVQRLVNVLEGYQEFNISIYTDKTALELALTSKKFDILLFDPSIYQGQIDAKGDTLRIMLFDDSENVPETCAGFEKVYKYQRISKIYQQILERYSVMCADKGIVVGEARTTSVAFFSPVGGVGKTTLALATATKWANMGKRVFYLNLEDIASDECYLPQTAERGISEIAALLGENINFSMKIQSLLMTKVEGMFYLNHFDSPNDIYEMKGSEVIELIHQIENTALFDYVVIDLGVSLSERTLSVFEAVEKIVIVEKNDSMSVAKLNRFYDQAHIINVYGDKMLRVLNFANNMGISMDTNIPQIGVINVVQTPDAAQFVTMLANNASMDFVANMMNM